MLVVEDDDHLRAMIRGVLEPEGYGITEAESVAVGMKLFREQPFDLVMLDVSLPDGSGLEVCRAVRQHRTRATTPVIILTAHEKIENKVEGFKAGADHYFVKPFNINELPLWTGALLRRLSYNEAAGGVIRLEDMQIDPGACVVRSGDAVISDLTRKEFDLLYYLIAHRPKVLSKESLLAKLWNATLTDNTVEVHIRHVRAKLGPVLGKRVATVFGRGYKFE